MLRSPLIGGLNGSLGSRSQSGLSVGEPGTPQRGSLLPPHSPKVSAAQHARPQAQAGGARQQSGNDMQVCAITNTVVLLAKRLRLPLLVWFMPVLLCNCLVALLQLPSLRCPEHEA